MWHIGPQPESKLPAFPLTPSPLPYSLNSNSQRPEMILPLFSFSVTSMLYFLYYKPAIGLAIYGFSFVIPFFKYEVSIKVIIKK
jgi:hypothetical protein